MSGDGWVDDEDPYTLVHLVGFFWGGINVTDLASRLGEDPRVAPSRRVVAAMVLLDACHRVKLITEADHRVGKELLFRLVSMLVKLTRSFETPLAPDRG